MGRERSAVFCFPSCSEMTWNWTLSVSTGWMMAVAMAPDSPPMAKGAAALKNPPSSFIDRQVRGKS